MKRFKHQNRVTRIYKYNIYIINLEYDLILRTWDDNTKERDATIHFNTKLPQDSTGTCFAVDRKKAHMSSHRSRLLQLQLRLLLRTITITTTATATSTATVAATAMVQYRRMFPVGLSI